MRAKNPAQSRKGSTSATTALRALRRGWPSFTDAQKQRIDAFICAHREETIAEAKHAVQVTTAADHLEDLCVAWELASAAERQRFLDRIGATAAKHLFARGTRLLRDVLQSNKRSSTGGTRCL
jgi:hypothetical protein